MKSIICALTFVLAACDPTTVTGSQGPVGPQGETGPQGPKGAAGADCTRQDTFIVSAMNETGSVTAECPVTARLLSCSATFGKSPLAYTGTVGGCEPLADEDGEPYACRCFGFSEGADYITAFAVCEGEKEAL